jgi:hypothetical protein
MNIWIASFLGGLVGAVFMDLAETIMARMGITSKVNVSLVGRWAMGMTRGQFAYRDIRTSRAHRHEIAAGWAFHLLIGGGVVGLFYPLGYLVLGLGLPETHLPTGVLFGLTTSLLPWLILLPAFGWGLFGRHAPAGAKPLLASPLTHIPYGLGLGLTLNFALAGQIG